MKNKLMLFPYDGSILPIIRHWESLVDKYHLLQLVAYKGTGLIGKDAAFACNHPPVGITVSDQLNPETNDWDTLLVSCSKIESDYSSIAYLETFRQCLQRHKQIIFVDYSRSEHLSIFRDLQNEYPDYVQLVNVDTLIHRSSFISSIKYTPLPVPVLLVGGMIHESDSLEIVLSLREYFIRSGRIVSCVVDSEPGLPFGLHTFRHVFDDKQLNEIDKIYAINRHAHAILQTERPELFIVEIPGTIIKYNNKVPGDFGIQMHMIIQALEPQLFICCLPFDFAVPPFIEIINKRFLERYGLPISAVQASNILIDSAGILQDEVLSCVRTDMKQVRQVLENNLSEGMIPIYDVLSQGAQDLYQHIDNLLKC